MSAAPDRLYGLPGAEVLHADPATLYESEIDPLLEEGPGPETEGHEIEEWTVGPAADAFPSGWMLTEFVAEWIADNYPGDEGLDDDIARAGSVAQVTEWFDAILAAWGKRTTYRMTDRRVATHLLAWDADGEPLLDGVRLYAKRGGGL